MKEIEQAVQEIWEASRRNDDILGYVVTGSRGKGFANQWSDYDLAIFVKDEALQKYQNRYENLPAAGRLYIFTLDSFKMRLRWRGPRHWERYTWAHLKVEHDRTGGEIERLLDEVSHVPLEHVDDQIRVSLRWYFNQVYHSIKNLRAGDMIGYHLEAAEGIRPFLEAVFCLHDRRLVPYYKYLRWELETYPLYQLNLSADELLHSLLQILETGNWRIQQSLLREAKRLFTAAGYGEFFDWKMARFSLNFQGPTQPLEHTSPDDAGYPLTDLK
jgi:predicted nucleotidyltransferase